jgi:hypothetical protein
VTHRGPTHPLGFLALWAVCRRTALGRRRLHESENDDTGRLRTPRIAFSNTSRTRGDSSPAENGQRRETGEGGGIHALSGRRRSRREPDSRRLGLHRHVALHRQASSSVRTPNPVRKLPADAERLATRSPAGSSRGHRRPDTTRPELRGSVANPVSASFAHQRANRHVIARPRRRERQISVLGTAYSRQQRSHERLERHRIRLAPGALGEVNSLAHRSALRARKPRTGPEADAQVDSLTLEIEIGCQHAPGRLELQRELEELLHAADRHAVAQRPSIVPANRGTLTLAPRDRRRSARSRRVDGDRRPRQNQGHVARHQPSAGVDAPATDRVRRPPAQTHRARLDEPSKQATPGSCHARAAGSARSAPARNSSVATV